MNIMTLLEKLTQASVEKLIRSAGYELHQLDCATLVKKYKVTARVVMLARQAVDQQQEQYFGTVKTNSVGSKS